MARFSLASWVLTLVVALSAMMLVSALPVEERTANAGVVAKLQGAAARMGPGSYPRAHILADGSILGSFAGGAGGTTVISAVRSTDQGATWVPAGTIFSRSMADSDVDNAIFQQLKTGRILCAFRNHDKQGEEYTAYRIEVYSSDDNGATWKPLSQLKNEGPTFHGLWEPFLRIANDGTLQMYYSQEHDGHNQVNYMRGSSDGGATWSEPVVVSQAQNVRDGMVGVADMGGGHLVAVFEAYFPFTVNQVVSTDDGRTWSGRKTIYRGAQPGSCAGAPQITRVGQNLVCIFMTDEDSTAPLKWIHNAGVKIITSGDGGETWGNKLSITPIYSVWPGLLTLDDTTFLAMSAFNGAVAQKVTLA